MKSFINLSISKTLLSSVGICSLLGSTYLLTEAAEPKSPAHQNAYNNSYAQQQQNEESAGGISRWFKKHMPIGGGNSEAEAAPKDRQANRNQTIRRPDAPTQTNVPAQNVSISTPQPAATAKPNSSGAQSSSVMKELEKLYEQNGVPAPEYHPMLENPSQTVVPSGRSGRVSRRDTKFLSRFGIAPGTPVDTVAQAQPKAVATQQPAVVQAPQPVIQQPVQAPTTPITVQINLQPTPVGNAIPPQGIQYQMPANGLGQPVTLPVPMQYTQAIPQQPAVSPQDESRISTDVQQKMNVSEKEFFPGDNRKTHDSESDEFFFDGDEDEKPVQKKAAAPAPAVNQPAAPVAGKFPTAEENIAVEMKPADPDNSFAQQDIEDKKPILKEGESPFAFPNSGIREANKQIGDDNWVGDAKKSTGSSIEAKTVSSSKIEANVQVSKDFEKAKTESPADRRLRLIRERQGQTGLKGFCPVVLRDQRELLDGNLELRVQHEGKTYHVSSTEAQAKFLSDPDRYAPANQGNDIVEQDKTGTREEGSLDHALWFGGKLYLFTSQDNQNEFSRQPRKYIK